VIEGVERLAQLPHDVVRHVDDVVDGPESSAPQPLSEPDRGRADPDTGDQAGGVARAEVGILHVDPREAGGRWLRLAHGDRGGAEPAPRERRHLPRDAEHREAIGPVRRDLDLEDHVVQPQIADEIPADRRVGREEEDARAVLADAQLGLGAEHPVRDRALDHGGVDPAASGQRGARRREGGPGSRRDVRRAAHDLEALGAGRHAADRERATRRVGGHRLDLADDDAAETGDQRRRRGDLDARHRQALGNLRGARLGLDEL
jgi:hypothetical protein